MAALDVGTNKFTIVAIVLDYNGDEVALTYNSYGDRWGIQIPDLIHETRIRFNEALLLLSLTLI